MSKLLIFAWTPTCARAPLKELYSIYLYFYFSISLYGYFSISVYLDFSISGFRFHRPTKKSSGLQAMDQPQRTNDSMFKDATGAPDVAGA